MSGSSSIPPKEPEEAETEVPEAESTRVDPVFRLTPAASSMSDEAFAEELLRDAHLPRDGAP